MHGLQACVCELAHTESLKRNCTSQHAAAGSRVACWRCRAGLALRRRHRRQRLQLRLLGPATQPFIMINGKALAP